MINLAVFASGNGSNFEVIANACLRGEINARVALCVCDRPGAFVVERAKRLGVPVLMTSPRDHADKASYESFIARRLAEENVELICLAGYMRLIGPTLLKLYGGRIVNIHPSLLPAFKGAHAIRDAFDYGVKVFGVTIHYVDETLDGGKIIAQEAFHYDGRDLDRLESMIHAVEHRLYPSTIKTLLNLTSNACSDKCK